MKLAIRAYIVTLILLTLVFAVSAQKRSDKDDRNTAPTVGVGGSVGGPTGLFTVYDGQTLRKGEYTFSVAYNNYDRDPGDVDITSVPLSFQVGVTDNLELFFTTEGWRGVKVNAPRNISGFYLPNSQVRIDGSLTSPPAILLGNGNSTIFRQAGSPFVQFPYTSLGTPRPGGAADNFPNVGSIYGSILPGIVLSTQTLGGGEGDGEVVVPVTFTTSPSYFSDAPFINRTYGTSSFNTMDFGAKWRMNSNESAVGYGLIASYRWYLDTADSFSGFNMMQRGSGPGANWGDVNLTFFADARLHEHINLSGNVGYTYTTNPKGSFGGSDYTLLDRADELHTSIGADFPVNKHLQYILELRSLYYVGGHTPNAFERNPLDALAGIRVFPRRWWGFGAAYRANLNQQGPRSFGDTPIPSGFTASTDPSGYVGQFWIGRREPRATAEVNKPASVDSVSLSDTVITLPCPAGTKSRSGSCNDNKTVSVSTKASDPENDVLTYNYTVSGGRVIGSGSNVQWDLSTAQPGTYTITTGVDDGCGVCGKTNTQTIKVEECPDCIPDCSCPTLTVSGPSGITAPGQSMTFVANVSGGSGGDPTYNWTVSSGTISSGQGTSSIMVDTTGVAAGGNITATVDIGSGDCGCNGTASDTGSIAPKPEQIPVDEFGPQKDDEVKARVDNFYIQLNNNPNAQGYIINYGTPAQIKARRAQIMKAINFRKYDASRVTFVDGPDNGSGINTKFSVVPPGAEKPTP
ncbi:MAG: hypothetical protein IPL32_01220 [Chloracidobacterium sp.]|nr:hypothetical protein [Chloracidobacterium sp.]